MEKRKVYGKFKPFHLDVQNLDCGCTARSQFCERSSCREGCTEYVLVNPQALEAVEDRAALWDKLAGFVKRNLDVRLDYSWITNMWMCSMLRAVGTCSYFKGEGKTPEEAVKNALAKAGEPIGDALHEGEGNAKAREATP
jgi:hypothetical protein